ncbi:MAG: transposase [Candidatus Sungbacteria bacterium]|nr:transposase [Candidatus Sungbacteria bacterium]
MPIRKIAFVENEIYHICNRGVEKRDIFLNNKDYFRAVHNLYEFNNKAPALNLYYKIPFLESYEAGPRKIESKGNPIVEILTFVLLPNHYHLLLRQLSDGGITEFMHKFGTGYAMYFNQKYQHVGPLFQGPFKAVLVKEEAHFIHLPFYIHANPLDLKFPEWRGQKLRNVTAAIKFLENYRWSSFPDYIGKKNFPSVTKRDFLLKIYGGPKKYREMMLDLLREMDLANIEDIALEDL